MLQSAVDRFDRIDHGPARWGGRYRAARRGMRWRAWRLLRRERRMS